MLRQLLNDEAGFIVSAELVLVATIVVIGMIVGLSEVQHAVVNELNDVAEAIGSINQSFYYEGMGAHKTLGNAAAFKSIVYGSAFTDRTDECDGNECQLSCDVGALPEAPK
ncbi:hypothetical protein [Planctomicrobium sp. SH664]|uniref:hypothetical protein n=1 Tax=Planctomicrobium sp. SH664 TaxID=3448125 RepID=UPI003F5B78D1